MYTGMERNICLTSLRDNHSFPKDWYSKIGMSFPDLEDMILRMVQREPSARPSAESVARHINSILGEFTVLALDQNHDDDPEIFLLRVEAEHREDTLGHTIRMIREFSTSSSSTTTSSASVCDDTTNEVQIVQYGLRSSSASSSNNNKPAAIMEFALKYDTCSSDKNNEKEFNCDDYDRQLQHTTALFTNLVSYLTEQPGIYKARHISSTASKSN